MDRKFKAVSFDMALFFYCYLYFMIKEMNPSVANFKKADWIFQLTLITISLGTLMAGPGFFIFFFGLGGWQLISFFTHLFFNKKYKLKVSRFIYTVILILVTISFVIFMFCSWNRDPLMMDGGIEYFLFLVILTPLMAIHYLVTCIIESNRISARVLSEKHN